MSAGQPTEFIIGAKGCITTKNVLEGRGRVRWMVRENPVAPEDSGWRVFSEFDTQEYLNDTSNSTVVSYNTVCECEPAAIAVYLMPVGSDIEIRHGAKRISIHDARDGGRDITEELLT